MLAQDILPLGIYATVVAPGAFRTNFLTPEALTITQNVIEEYQVVRASHAKYHQLNDVQAGYPDKAAEMLMQLTEHATPPVSLFLGSDAYRRTVAKTDALCSELEAWKDLTRSTDY